MTSARHSSNSQRWFTPKPVVDLAKLVLGTINLDPASESEANRSINASVFYHEDGLNKSWSGVMFVNPPGGKEGNKSIPLMFWEKLIQTRHDARLVHAIYVAFSIEQLQTSQGKPYDPMTLYPVCIPDKRLKFISPDGKANSPTHASAIIYVPGIKDNSDGFIQHFAKLGAILAPM